MAGSHLITNNSISADFEAPGEYEDVIPLPRLA